MVIRNKTEHHTIQYGRATISFDLSFSPRKRLSITVDPDQKVIVKAPDDQPMDAVMVRVRKRADWIQRQLDYFDKFSPLPPERQYVSGETYYYLGRQYRLKVLAGAPASVKLKGRYFRITTNDPNDTDRVKVQLQEWYLAHAKTVLQRRLDACHKIVRRFNIPFPTVRYRRMKKRWGSCSPSGTVMLNTELAKAPVNCIDYVILHELCHLKEPKHCKGFYRSSPNACRIGEEKRAVGASDYIESFRSIHHLKQQRGLVDNYKPSLHFLNRGAEERN